MSVFGTIVLWLRGTMRPSEFALEHAPEWILDLRTGGGLAWPPQKQCQRAQLWSDSGVVATEAKRGASFTRESRDLPIETVRILSELATRAIEEGLRAPSAVSIRDAELSVLRIFRRDPYRAVRHSLYLAGWRSVPPGSSPSPVLLARALFAEHA